MWWLERASELSQRFVLLCVPAVKQAARYPVTRREARCTQSNCHAGTQQLWIRLPCAMNCWSSSNFRKTQLVCTSIVLYLTKVLRFPRHAELIHIFSSGSTLHAGNTRGIIYKPQVKSVLPAFSQEQGTAYYCFSASLLLGSNMWDSLRAVTHLGVKGLFLPFVFNNKEDKMLVFLIVFVTFQVCLHCELSPALKEGRELNILHRRPFSRQLTRTPAAATTLEPKL